MKNRIADLPPIEFPRRRLDDRQATAGSLALESLDENAHRSSNTQEPMEALPGNNSYPPPWFHEKRDPDCPRSCTLNDTANPPDASSMRGSGFVIRNAPWRR